ncbi:MAG TPA: hypothetical protein PKI03_06250, partial [Pseudomonadota bacterium]|nr:hypothetical protein [Pseudomonadota bacterium]
SSLAVELLSTLDLHAGPAAMADWLGLSGHSLRDPAIAELQTRILRFLDGEIVRRLLQPGAPPLHTAQPFDVPLGALRVRDRFDWVIGDPSVRGDSDLHVLQLRYGYSPDPGSPLAQAQLQILAQAAAAHFGWQPGGRRLQLAFCDLREAVPRPRFRPLDALLDEGRGSVIPDADAALLSLAEAICLPRLPVRDCLALGCGYRDQCHPGEPR